LLDDVRIEEAKYRSLTETAQDIIMACDLRGQFQYLNHVGLEFLDLGADDYTSKNIFDFLTDPELIVHKFRECREAKARTVVFEDVITNKYGDAVPFEVNSSFSDPGNGRAGVISILRNITERKQAQEQLLAQNTELQLINSELDKFVYRTSHDLRAPLTSILGLIDIIRESGTGDDELQMYMEMMEKSIFRLDNVIRSIIDYSKSNRMQVKPETINIEEVYADIIESIGFIKGTGSLHHSSMIDSLAPLMTDKTAMVTILSNLISNAVKYRRPVHDSFVKFTYRCDDTEAVIQVIDNGEGIPADKASLVFDMFYRNSVTSDGSGLGLYIVKQNATKLGGTIDLESEPGKGSTFTVRIPNLWKLVAHTS
jgi:PAS domain S-box-containing protein